MHARAIHLIETLSLVSHPEGGSFAVVYRSPHRVLPTDGRPPRAALTTILFLLAKGEISRWHRVASDEVWHYYEGDPLALTWIEVGSGRVRRHVLGPVGEHTGPVTVVPAGCWQTARPWGSYSLVGCTVAPGFEFDDFELLGNAKLTN